jgi:hypothetical protein
VHFEVFAAHVSRALFASCAPYRGATTRELPVAPVCGVCRKWAANSRTQQNQRYAEIAWLQFAEVFQFGIDIKTRAEPRTGE